MAFLVRRPLLLIIIAIICVVVIIQFTRAPVSEPLIEMTPTLSSAAIATNENATLTMVTENLDTHMHSVEYRIIGTFTSDQLKLYYRNGTALPPPVQNGSTNTIIYPLTWTLDTGSQVTVSILVQGLDPKVDSIRYTIFLEVWADGELSERESVQLTVTSGA